MVTTLFLSFDLRLMPKVRHVVTLPTIYDSIYEVDSTISYILFQYSLSFFLNVVKCYSQSSMSREAGQPTQVF